MNSNDIKLQSKKLKEAASRFGYEIKHSHALEIISQMENDSHWHLAALNDPNFILTGIKKLDQDLGGGLRKGTLSTVVGKTNSGKSLFCLSLACNALRKNKKVLIYNMDDSTESVKIKILANLSNIPLKKILNNELSDKEKKLIEKIVVNKLEDNLVIVDKAALNYSIDQMKESIFEQRVSFKFDLLLVDYVQLLHSRDTNEDYRIQLKKNSSQLWKIANSYDCAVLTPAQASRTVQGSSLSLVDISGSTGLAQNSTNVMILNSVDEQLNISLEKSSYVRGNVYPLNSSFEHCNLIIK